MQKLTYKAVAAYRAALYRIGTEPLMNINERLCTDSVHSGSVRSTCLPVLIISNCFTVNSNSDKQQKR